MREPEAGRAHCGYSGVNNTQSPTTIGSNARATVTVERKSPTFRRWILRQSPGHPGKYPTAPWGKIIPPFRTEFMQPLLCSPLLLPGQIGKRTCGIPFTLNSLQHTDTRVSLYARRIHGVRASGHANSLTQKSVNLGIDKKKEMGVI